MPRQKKPTYEYVEKLGLYRKRIKDADGKYVALYGKTQDELTGKIEEAQRKMEKSEASRENPTVLDYANKWVALNTGSITKAAKNDYANAIKVHISPMIGQRLVKDITTDDIKMVLLPLSNKSASLYNKVMLTLKKVFDSALDNDLIAKSPCAKIKRGGVKPKEKHALSHSQSTTLMDATENTVAYPFVMIGLYSGLRREEILGLKWDCVVLNGEAPHISVRRAVRWENNQPIVEERLKSPSSKRDIPIPMQLVECLSSEKKKSKSDFVISNRTGGPRSQSQFRNLWNVVEHRTVGEQTRFEYDGNGGKRKITTTHEKGEKCKNHLFSYTIDFEVTPHMLRHTYITNLFLSGMDVKTVQYLAGHSTVEMTLNIYTHITQNKPIDLIGMVNNAFEVKNEVK